MEMVQNAYTIRTNLQSPGGHTRKDINKECDFPETVNIGVREYKEKYDRSPIASRVVEAMPSECWNSAPLLFEDEDADVETQFEKEWDELGKKFLGEESWFDGDQEGNPIWEYLARADKLSGIGHYGMILLGIDDGKPLHEPIDGFTDPNPEDIQPGPIYVNNADKPKRELLYISVFGEDSCQTGGIEFENNPHSPRYRKPKMYNIDLGDMNTTEGVTAGREERTVRVHWSRIVHIADNLNSSEVIGVPRMRPVWNNLLSLDKIYGADGEAFWKNCTPHTYFETNPQLGGDVSVDVDALRSSVWDMDNGLQKWMALMGMTAKTVAPQVVDPTAHIAVHIGAICIQLTMPQSVFMGSERGGLNPGAKDKADDSRWNDQVRGRQNKYVIPRIIVPFINRLIQIGVLSPPKKVYKCEWPDPETLTPQEKADLALNRVDTMVKYIAGNVMQLMDPLDFLSREMDIDEDEAKGILERAAKAAEEEADKQAEEQMKMMKEQAKLNPPPQPGQPVPGKPGLPPVVGKPSGKQPPVPGKPIVPPAKPKGVPQPSLNEEDPVANKGKGGGFGSKGGKFTGGRWVTTDDGHRVYLKGGVPVAGNPKVIAKMKGKGTESNGKQEAEKEKLKTSSPSSPSKTDNPKEPTKKTSKPSKQEAEKEKLKTSSPSSPSKTDNPKEPTKKTSKPSKQEAEKENAPKPDKSSGKGKPKSVMGKLKGDQKEAEDLLNEVASIDKISGGKIGKFLEKYPVGALSVGKDTRGSEGLYNPGTKQLSVKPSNKYNPDLYEPGTMSVLYGQKNSKDSDDSAGQKAMQKAVFVHELGHHMALTVVNKGKQGPEGVYRKEIIEAFQKDKKKVTKYAETQPHEYFAESFAAYHLDPKLLSPIAKRMVENVMAISGEV